MQRALWAYPLQVCAKAILLKILHRETQGRYWREEFPHQKVDGFSFQQLLSATSAAAEHLTEDYVTKMTNRD